MDDARDPLRSALDMLIDALCQTGQTAQVRSFAQRQTDLLQPSSSPPTEDEARRYVEALGRLAEILEAEGASPEALVCCSRAVAFLADLPATTSDALTGDRGLLAGVEAAALADIGDLAGSAAAWMESASYWKRVNAPYGSHDPVQRIVASLNNAAVNYDRLGKRVIALDTIRDAAQLALSERGEPMRLARPELYEQVHATYISYLIEAGADEQALLEVERLWERPTPSSTPLPAWFASSLLALSVSLANTGRFVEAVRANSVAAAAFDAIEVPADDWSLLAQHASILSNLAANLAQTGAPAAGAEAGARAAALWRQVRTARAEHRIELVTALANQGECLRVDARVGDAARVFTEAVELLRECPDNRGMLADLVGRRALCDAATGDDEAGAQGYAEEVELRRDAWQGDPSAGAALANALTELAMANERLKRLPEAFAAAGQALEVYQHLFGDYPGDQWRGVAYALRVQGTVLLKQGLPVRAVAPLADALHLGAEADDTYFTGACSFALRLVHAMDRSGVEAEWARVSGSSWPLE